MRMFADGAIGTIEPALVHLSDGGSRRVTMHTIEGTREQIKRQLLRSIDAFFELLEDQA
jgi:hypothetical protein